MHPLSVFPQLLTFGLIAPTILRLFIGFFLVFKGKQRFGKAYKWMSTFYVVSGVLLVLGLFTQVAVILGFLMIGFDDWADKKISPLSRDTVILHSLVAIVLISLLFTGPGFLALDLPL